MPVPSATLGDRSLFPDLEAEIYLAHAAIAPPSLPVRDACRTLTDDYARRGHEAFLRWLDERGRLRSALALLVGAEARDIAFIPSTTRGIIDVALCFPWRRGDAIVVFSGEFPANVTPWQRAAELFGLELRMLALKDFEASTDQGMSRLAVELRRGVRLVAVSAVEFQTGLRMPIAEMAAACHAHGAELFVDAVQAAGVVPIDVVASGVDYLAAGSHKWLMGLEGAGFLYVRPCRIGALRPSVAGWLSHEEPTRFLFEGEGHLAYDRPIRERADFIESGNVNAVGLAALQASVGLITSLGVRAIFDHVTGYLDALEEGLLARGFESLRARDPERRSGILGVRPPKPWSSVAVHKAITQRSVACSVPDGVLRFAPHWPNALSEVSRVLALVDEALQSIPSTEASA